MYVLGIYVNVHAISEFFCFSLFQDAEKFGSLLTQTEDWLYDEGDDQLKQVYIDKLKELKVRISDVSLYSVLSIGT